MKREDLPGFVRELPITILTLAIILSVFWPIYRHYKKKAEELKTTKAQEIELIQSTSRAIREDLKLLKGQERFLCNWAG